MESFVTAVRRVVLLTLLAALAAVAWSWWREQSAPPSPAGPAEWPPLPPRPDDGATPTTTAAAATTPAPPPAPTATSGDGESGASWVEPLDDGTTPPGFPVKAKDSSGIYHVPGGRFHERTRPDRCYVSAEAAEADGYRRSKS